MNPGKAFEKNWQDSYKGTPYFHLRLKDANKWVMGEGTKFTTRNICDSIQLTMPFLWLLELKSTQGSSISFKGKNPMIKEKQIKDLSNYANYTGVIPGFVLNFRSRETKKTQRDNVAYFVHVKEFVNFISRSKKNSINEADCQIIGIKIACILKLINYRYDIKGFIDKAIPIYINKGYIDKSELVKLKEWILNIVSIS